MNIFNKLAFILYTFTVELVCLLSMVFFGILADENVKIESFYKSYFLGIEFNYSFLNYTVLFLLLLTFIVQIIFVLNYIQKKFIQE